SAQLGPGPQGVVALEEAQLHPVVSLATRDVEHAPEAPGRAAEGGEAEPHVMRSSIEAVTRWRTGRPRAKRSRSSRITSAICRRTSACAEPTWGVRTAPRALRSGWAGESGSQGSVT